MLLPLSTDADADARSSDVADILLATVGERLTWLRAETRRTVGIQRALIAEMARRGATPSLTCTASFVDVSELT